MQWMYKLPETEIWIICSMYIEYNPSFFLSFLVTSDQAVYSHPSPFMQPSLDNTTTIVLSTLTCMHHFIFIIFLLVDYELAFQLRHYVLQTFEKHQPDRTDKSKKVQKGQHKINW